MKCLRPKPLWSGERAADAMASKDICQIGGFIRFPSGTQIWFSEKITFQDFSNLNIPVTPEMQNALHRLRLWRRLLSCTLSAEALLDFVFP